METILKSNAIKCCGMLEFLKRPYIQYICVGKVKSDVLLCSPDQPLESTKGPTVWSDSIHSHLVWIQSHSSWRFLFIRMHYTSFWILMHIQMAWHWIWGLACINTVILLWGVNHLHAVNKAAKHFLLSSKRTVV